MTRVATYGSNQLYLSRISALQQRISQRTIQVTSEKKSENYTGIAADSNRLINMENEKARAETFITNNDMAQTRLKAADTSMQAIEDTMKEFQSNLENFYTNQTRGEQDVKNLQNWAFQSMIDMQSYLSSSMDGQFMFSGGRVSTEPVKLAASSLSDFQSIYDGSSSSYPTTRAADLLDMQTDATVTGDLTFDASAGTITAANAGTLSDIPVGSRVTASGSTSNDKSYTVTSNDGTTIGVSPLVAESATGATITTRDVYDSNDTTALTADLVFTPGNDTIQVSNSTGFSVGQIFTVSGTSSNDDTYTVESITAGPPDTIAISSNKVAADETASATLSAQSWYQGDNITIEQRIDQDRSVDLGIFASDPAFEKAIRAMGIIAQGAYGTDGGLENHPERLEQARFLVSDALSHPASEDPPFGAEESSDLAALRAQLGVTQNVIQTKTEKHESYVGFLYERISDMENVDKTEAIALLLDDQNALEAGYQTLSTVRSLSLLDYLK